MARGRMRRGGEYAQVWPGYVDVLSTLLLVVTFLMSIFMLAQYFASQEASGRARGRGTRYCGRGGFFGGWLFSSSMQYWMPRSSCGSWPDTSASGAVGPVGPGGAALALDTAACANPGAEGVCFYR